MTNVPDVCVAVSTADCVPVLLYAPDRKVVAAVHAGWRGTVLHIARKAASLMIEAYDCDPTQLVAGIGPSISQAAFEVGEEVVKSFSNRRASQWSGFFDVMRRRKSAYRSMGNQPFTIVRGRIALRAYRDRWHLYLYRYEDYFSARRLSVKSGRILTGICLKKS